MISFSLAFHWFSFFRFCHLLSAVIVYILFLICAEMTNTNCNISKNEFRWKNFLYLCTSTMSLFSGNVNLSIAIHIHPFPCSTKESSLMHIFSHNLLTIMAHTSNMSEDGNYFIMLWNKTLFRHCPISK